MATTVVPTSSGVDHTLKARVGGLRPDTHYWYVWQSATGMSPVGRTKTAPDPASEKTIAVGYSSCQRLTHGFFNAHADAAAHDDLDLYAFLGDYTYEYAAAKESGGAADELATNDLASYRAKLRFYRADPHLRELHRVHPTVHTWDDHEVEDNYTDGKGGHPFASQRAAGYRASFEWHPRLSVPGTATGCTGAGAWAGTPTCSCSTSASTAARTSPRRSWAARRWSGRRAACPAAERAGSSSATRR